MKLRIISDGYPNNTKIVNADTGDELQGVTEISWVISINELATVTLTMIGVPVDVIGYTKDDAP